MNKSDLINRLKAENGGAAFITRTTLKEILGVGFTTIDHMLATVDHIPTGGAAKRYLIDDVAAAFMEIRRR